MNAANKKKKVRGASMFFDSNDPTYKQKYFYHTFNRFLRFLFFSVDLGKVFWRGEKKKIKTKQAWIFEGIVYIGGNHSRNITIANIDITC